MSKNEVEFVMKVLFDFLMSTPSITQARKTKAILIKLNKELA
jgi:hypothetical protein